MNAKEINLIHLNYNKNHILETNSVLLDNWSPNISSEKKNKRHQQTHMFRHCPAKKVSKQIGNSFLSAD